MSVCIDLFISLWSYRSGPCLFVLICSSPCGLTDLDHVCLYWSVHPLVVTVICAIFVCVVSVKLHVVLAIWTMSVCIDLFISLWSYRSGPCLFVLICSSPCGLTDLDYVCLYWSVHLLVVSPIWTMSVCIDLFISLWSYRSGPCLFVLICSSPCGFTDLDHFCLYWSVHLLVVSPIWTMSVCNVSLHLLVVTVICAIFVCVVSVHLIVVSAIWTMSVCIVSVHLHILLFINPPNHSYWKWNERLNMKICKWLISNKQILMIFTHLKWWIAFVRQMGENLN